MNPEQIQDIVMGTIHGMMTSGDLVMPSDDRGAMGADDAMPEQPQMPEQPPEQPPMPDMGQPQ
jgi:hypothetical protein